MLRDGGFKYNACKMLRSSNVGRFANKKNQCLQPLLQHDLSVGVM